MYLNMILVSIEASILPKSLVSSAVEQCHAPSPAPKVYRAEMNDNHKTTLQSVFRGSESAAGINHESFGLREFSGGSLKGAFQSESPVTCENCAVG